jgi:hypothetical protein
MSTFVIFSHLCRWGVYAFVAFMIGSILAGGW